MLTRAPFRSILAQKDTFGDDMDRRTSAAITWGGGGIILAAGAAALVLNVVMGESIFAARLVAGLVSCL